MKITRSDVRIGTRAVVLAGMLVAAGWFGFVRPIYDSYGTGRRPLVIVNGQTQQIQAADYVSTVGGLTTNATGASTGDIQTTTETASTTLTVAGQFATSGTLTITTWTTGQTLNDWAPTGLATANVISVQQSSGTTNITGIAAQPTGTEITIYNREASVGTINLQYETGSSAPNQLVLPGAAALGFPWEIQPGASLKLRYGGSNWQFVSSGTTLFPYLQTHYGALLQGSTQLNKVLYQPQLDTSTGTVNDFVFFSTTTVLVWSGSSDATFTGMIGGGDGRIACVINASSGHVLTLANLNGGSIGQHQYQNIGDADAVLTGGGSFACYIYDGTTDWRMSAFGSTTLGAATSFTSSKNKGTITLGGAGTATVNSGAICTCTDTTAANAFKCSVSGTTLTATGTGTDVIAYLCF